MDLAAAWDASAYSNDLTEFDVFKTGFDVFKPYEAAGPLVEAETEDDHKIIVIEDDESDCSTCTTDEVSAEEQRAASPQAQSPTPAVVIDLTVRFSHVSEVINKVLTRSQQDSPEGTPDVQSEPNTPVTIPDSDSCHDTSATNSSASTAQKKATSQAAEVQNPPTTSRLLSLPPEIRNMIWTYTVTDDNKVIHLHLLHEYSALELRSRLNITTVNRQIRHESLLMFYASNTFLMRSKPYPYKTPHTALANWLRGLKDEYRKVLGRVVVCSKKKASTEKLVKWDWEIERDRCGDTGFVVTGPVEIGGEEGHHCKEAHYLVVRKEEVAAEGGNGGGEAGRGEESGGEE